MHISLGIDQAARIFRPQARLAVAASLTFLAGMANADASTVTLTSADVIGTSSFNTAGNWSSGTAPAPGNIYQSAYLLRTPANSVSLAFLGNSLEIQTGGALRNKTGAAITVTNLIVHSGATNELSSPTVTGGTAVAGTLAGGLTLNGTAIFHAGINGSDTAGSTYTISSMISGSGGFATSNSDGTILLSGSNTYSGATIVAGPAANTLQLQANVANTSAGVSAAMSASSALTLQSGTTLQLRSDNPTTFAPASITLPNAADTNNFDVNSVSGVATGKTLTLAGGLSYLDSVNQTINVTGGSNYILGLGTITTTATGHNPYMAVTLNVVPGIGAIMASYLSGNYGTYLDLAGGGTVTVTGTIGNTSDGSSVLLVNGGTTGVLQGLSVKSGTGDAYRYFVQNGTLVLDNSGALINNTTGSGLTMSLFILGAATNLYSGVSGVSPPSGIFVATNNSYNCAVYLGDVNFSNGGLKVGATLTNYISDGDIGFTNFGTMTIGGQNTSGTNIYANPIILGWTLNRGKSVTLVAATGGEVDFTGGIWPNGTDTTAGVTVGDAAHSGVVKLISTNTYAGGTTVAYGTLLVNSPGSSGTGANNVTVNSSGTLGGSGIISGNVIVNGKTLPGINGATNTIGGNLTYNSGGAANFYLGSSATSGGNDQIVLTGASSTLNCGGVNVGINCGSSLDQTTDYPLIKLTGASAGITGGFNATPVWLGATPANASLYSVVALAKTVVLHYNATGTTNLAVVTNLPASNVTGTSATLNGQLLSTGGQYPSVQLYYGTSDGGTNPAAWMSSLNLGLQNGGFSATISNLTGNTTYYFAASASNSAGTAWGVASRSFTTLPVTLPTIANLPATSVFASFATLNGQVLTTGNAAPAVQIYYGTSDGGTNPAAWTGNIGLGAQVGTFSAQVAALTAGTTYYFTASATNPAGLAWATPSKSFTTPPLTRVPVLTFHYDNSRQGQNTNETLLTPSNVNVTNFGKLFSQAVDGYVYAQPLIMTNVTIPGQGVHDVVYVATENDTVYAFDADSNTGVNGGLLWSNHLGSPVSYATVGYKPDGDMSPSNIGITGTPVIDPVSGTLYVDTSTYTNGTYTHLIHALNITTGKDQSYSPVIVTASVAGTASDGNGSVVHFISQEHAQRPALTLANGILYASYGSYQDTTPYHGWVIGFNPTNLVQLTNDVFNVNPNTTECALWMGGGGLIVDTNNNIYFETANGTFDVNTGGPDYGDSFVKLAFTNNDLQAVDYFTPYNQASLSSGDTDLGSGAPIMLPDAAGSATYPHLLVGAGKQGTIYLVNRDGMGHYSTGGSDSQIIQSDVGIIGGGGSYATPAYFNNRIYYTGKTYNVLAFGVTNAAITTAVQSQSSTQLGAFTGSPVVSASGTTNGIVWVTDPGAYSSSGPAVLHAYNATNLAMELYNSSQNLARDNPGGAVKMTAPTVTGGKVYVGAEYTLSVYGINLFLPVPVITPNGGAFTNSVTVTLSDATAGVSLYYTLNGTTPTGSTTLYTGPFVLTSNAVVQVVATTPGAVNSPIASASFANTAAAGNGAGLTGAYFANQGSASAFTGVPTLVETNGPINFNWGTTGPAPAVGATNYTVRWTGTVQAQYNEPYTFSTTADDGVRLYINGQLLIDDWTNQPPTTQSGTITLAAQQLYNLELDYYYSNDYGAQVSLAWSSPSTPPAVIPQTQLYPYTNPPPSVMLLSPTNSASYTAAASVTLSADADTPYNPIGVVNFYANNTLLGGVTNLPYTLTATGLAQGSYALTAVAVDGSGLSSTSAPVSITVAPGSGLPYGLTTNGAIPAFFNLPTTFNGALPPLLSETGVFSNTPAMIPTNGLIPYLPNVPLWSDGALKIRYLAVPNNGGAITPGQQISFAPTGTWSFPAGTVFVKTFELQTNQTDTNSILRLETRLLVRDINGAVYGVTYKWRPDNSEADLLTSSSNELVTIITPTGTQTQTWYYPSPADCLTCHTPVANYVLGVNTRQLNNTLTYPATGVADNQLRTLNRLGIFNPAFDEAAITNFEQLSALTNLTASLQQRSRSYLDANCAQCHQPGGTGITFDARYDTPLVNQNLTNYPAKFNLGVDNALIIAPQDIWRSTIYLRMNTTNATTKMPPLARNLIDTNAVAVFGAWINSLPGIPTIAPPAITPNGGTFFNAANVTLLPPDTNATLYYTLDGSLPTTNSTLYSGAINLTNSATLSANAFETGSNNSVAASALFTILPQYFTSSGFLTNGQFQMGFMGVTGSNYVLQATTNFSTWTPIMTNNVLTNLFNWFDPNATNYPYRFYRVVQP